MTRELRTTSAMLQENPHLNPTTEMSASEPKITVITAVYNRAGTVGDAIESVLSQSYSNLEYIIVDGMSKDGTDRVVQKYSDKIDHIIREPDDGIYDALNKGVRAATGDIIGFLHADDVLAHASVLESIANAFVTHRVQAVYGDLVYVRAEPPHPIVRYWHSGPFDARKFRWGWMPPHPTVYLARECYDRWGGYRQDLDIAADYELLVRMMVANHISVAYVEDVLVNMRLGGKSNASVRNRLHANYEDRKAWELNGLPPPIGLRVTKPLRKLQQYWVRPKNLNPSRARP